MTTRIKGHFDGKTIVPDEPVDWPAGTEVVVESRSATRSRPANSLEERLAALHRISARATRGVVIPADAFRRENMYGDEGR